MAWGIAIFFVSFLIEIVVIDLCGLEHFKDVLILPGLTMYIVILHY